MPSLKWTDRLTVMSSQTAAGIINCNISDHQPYFVVLDYLMPIKLLPDRIKVYVNTSKANNDFKAEIFQTCSIEKFDNKPDCDPNINYNILHDAITSALDKHLPARYVRYNKYKHKRESWMTNGIMNSIKFRDKLYIKLRSTDVNSEQHNKYKVNLQTYNRILKQNIRLAKKKYYHDCFDKFKYDMKNMWSTIKDIINKSKSNDTFPKYFMINDIQVNDPKTIANAFNNFFTGIGPKLANTIVPPLNKCYKDYLCHPVLSNFQFKHITVENVKLIIDNLKSKSSTGIDQLSNKLFKLIKDELVPPLTLVINQIFSTGIFPHKLKIAKVIPLFKKDKNYILDNYRPVSLLPSLSKIVEKVMYIQLYEYFQNNRLFYDSQYGFRSKHSTELAALELLNRIVTQMDQKEIPINIYLDLSKAFDTLDHNILTEKLKFYGITGKSLNLLTDYLTNREQCVEYKNAISDLQFINTGVPQGSILGPLLFIIYLNDIINVSYTFIHVIYANDTALFPILS